MVTMGRVGVAAIERWLPVRVTYHILPFLLAGRFVIMRSGQEEVTAIAAAMADGVIALYQLGYGIAAFGVGPLLDGGVKLSSVYAASAAIAHPKTRKERPMRTALTPRPAATAPTPDESGAQVADVFVIFGITGDLAKVMTFNSLYRLEERGLLDCPIVGVAVSDWSDDDLRAHAREAILNCSGQIDTAVFDRLAGRMSYVSGDFGEPETYERVGHADRAQGRVPTAAPPCLRELATHPRAEPATPANRAIQVAHGVKRRSRRGPKGGVRIDAISR